MHRVTEATLVPDPSLSIRERAIAAWPGAWQGKNLRDILVTLGYDVDRPWRELPQADRDWILFTDEQPVVTVHAGARGAGASSGRTRARSPAPRRYVMHTLAKTQSATLRRARCSHVETRRCPVCGGRRLRPEALAVTFAGRTIAELAALPLDGAREVLRPTAELEGRTPPAVRDLRRGDRGRRADRAATCVARIAVLARARPRLPRLDRAHADAVPGELQRLRLATQLRSGLFGVVYVLDEPSAGLHPADAEPLLDGRSTGCGRAGNSLLVVEHDLDVVRRADWVVDVGPGRRRAAAAACSTAGRSTGSPTSQESVTRPVPVRAPAPPIDRDAPRRRRGWLRAARRHAPQPARPRRRRSRSASSRR